MLSAILLISWGFTSLAQNPGFIQGAVKENGNPVEFANVFLTLKNDSVKIVAGAVSDSVGKFQLEKLPYADYVLNVQMIGFVTRQLAVSLTPAKQRIDVHDIVIEPDTLMLKAVEITGMHNIIQKTEEGYVVNAVDNLTQIGGTAADLLKNMPGILVGADGDITLRGKSPLTLINGRVSGIAGVDRAAQLSRIPASSIDRIEIINNPSAKYDADAEGGIINIVLKKNEDNGTNGAFAVGAGLGDRYRLNASMQLNHKTDKWNVGVAYDNWYTTRTRKLNGDRINFDLPDEYFLTQRRFDERLILYQNAKATVDYAPNKKNNLSFEALWAFPGEDNNETLNNTYRTLENDFTSRDERFSNEIRRSHALEFSLHYAKYFNNPGKSLVANLSSTVGNDKENTNITTQPRSEDNIPVGDTYLQRTHTYEKTNLSSMAVDYAQPFTNRGTLETGYKSIFRFLNADFERASFEGGDFVIDPLNSGVFDFREQIHAVYTQYTGWTGQKEEPEWKYILGLRAEQVWNDGKTLDESQAFSNSYFNIYPSANIFYYTPARNNFKLSYSRRINRPGLGQLNPFVDITDSLNQHGGNPGLKPELIHSMEFGYYQALQKASLSMIVFYRMRRDAILPYTVLDSNGVAFSQPLNFGNATTLGFEAIATFNPISNWSLNFSFSAYEIHIDNNSSTADVSTHQLNWYSKLINNFTLFKNLKLQVIGSYTSPTAIPQGKTVAVYYVDLGLMQEIMKGKGRLGLTVTDVFNTQQYGAVTSDYNFTFSRKAKLDTRAVMLTFGYTFGTSFKENMMENKFKNE